MCNILIDKHILFYQYIILFKYIKKYNFCQIGAKCLLSIVLNKY